MADANVAYANQLAGESGEGFSVCVLATDLTGSPSPTCFQVNCFVPSVPLVAMEITAINSIRTAARAHRPLARCHQQQQEASRELAAAAWFGDVV